MGSCIGFTEDLEENRIGWLAGFFINRPWRGCLFLFSLGWARLGFNYACVCAFTGLN